MKQVRVRIDDNCWTHEAVLEVPATQAVERLAAQIANAVRQYTATNVAWDKIADIEANLDCLIAMASSGDEARQDEAGFTLVLRDGLAISAEPVWAPYEFDDSVESKGGAMSKFKFYAGAHPDNEYWSRTKTLIERLVNAGFAYPTGSRVYAPTAVTDASDVDYVVDTRKLSAELVGFLLEGCGLCSHQVTEAKTESGEITGAEYDGASPVYIVDRVVSEEGCYLVPARPEPEPRFNLILPKPEDVDGWLYATKTLELVRDKGDSWLVRALQDKDSRVAMFRLLRFVKREEQIQNPLTWADERDVPNTRFVKREEQIQNP